MAYVNEVAVVAVPDVEEDRGFVQHGELGHVLYLRRVSVVRQITVVMSTSVCPCSVVRPCPYLVVLGRVHPLRVFRRHLERLVVRVALDRVDIPGFTDDGGSGEA